jgi:nicotinamide-nucleotide amidase
MVAEIVSVGTELLLGQITDTNASYLGRTLAGLGIDLYYKSTVGDNEARVLDTLRRARDRADLILTSGGLGPTEDDLTKECVAAVFDEELVMDEGALRQLETFFARRGVVMPPRNAKQALKYGNGRMIDNPNGTAPGALLEKHGKIVISLPGPPNEMLPMVENHVVPFLSERLSGSRQYLVTRVLRFIGIGESALEHQVQDLLHGANPTVAPLAHTGEVHLRLGAKAAGVAEAESLLAPVEAELRRRVGKFIYGTDRTTLEEAVIDLLRQRGLTVACAEYCTGGALGARLTQPAGSYGAFRGALVAHDQVAAAELHGAPVEVDAGTAMALACTARERIGADVGISICGVAGPEAVGPHAPAGLVFIGLAMGGRVRAWENHFIGIREDIRRRSTQAALQRLRESLLETGWGGRSTDG